MRCAVCSSIYLRTAANSYCGNAAFGGYTSSDPAAPGHLKVNCPVGAREATLGCPLKGKAWVLPHQNNHRACREGACPRPTEAP